MRDRFGARRGHSTAILGIILTRAVPALAAAIVSDNATNDIEAVAVKVRIVERTN
jgi:hypothetical protein